MNHLEIAGQLENNRETFRSLFEGRSREQQSWSADPGQWSLHGILCHLADEELLDFRLRCEHILTTPELEWPATDPVGWIETHDYGSKEYDTVLAELLAERDRTVAWLRGLENPNWENAYQHPSFGPVSAKLILDNWLAHDYLHIRQIIKVNYLYLRSQSDVDFRYAGEW